jgi:hypothetical protein
MREHINVFVGDENVRYTGGLATKIAPGPKSPSSPLLAVGERELFSATVKERLCAL